LRNNYQTNRVNNYERSNRVNNYERSNRVNNYERSQVRQNREQRQSRERSTEYDRDNQDRQRRNKQAQTPEEQLAVLTKIITNESSPVENNTLFMNVRYLSRQISISSNADVKKSMSQKSFRDDLKALLVFLDSRINSMNVNDIQNTANLLNVLRINSLEMNFPKGLQGKLIG
jgi:hypothetical protein